MSHVQEDAMALLDVCRPRCSRASNIGSHMASILCLAYLCLTTVSVETGQPEHPARVRAVLLTFMSVFFGCLSRSSF